MGVCVSSLGGEGGGGGCFVAKPGRVPPCCFFVSRGECWCCVGRCTQLVLGERLPFFGHDHCWMLSVICRRKQQLPSHPAWDCDVGVLDLVPIGGS